MPALICNERSRSGRDQALIGLRRELMDHIEAIERLAAPGDEGREAAARLRAIRRECDRMASTLLLSLPEY